MKTREQAIQACHDAHKYDPHARTYSIYQVGGAWMYTSEDVHRVQAQYKRTIKNWTTIISRY